MSETILFGLGLWGLFEFCVAFPKATLIIAFFLIAFGIQPAKNMPDEIRGVTVALGVIGAIIAGVKLIWF